MKQTTLFGVKPIQPTPTPAKPDKKADRTDSSNRYEMMGLDANKLAKDPDTKIRILFCVYDDIEVLKGFSLCFANFVLSHQAALRLQKETPPENINNEKCTHCRQLKPFVYSSMSNWFHLCPDCVNDAVTYLEKPVVVPPGTQFTLL